MKQIQLAIIGSAGRKEPISPEHWRLMVSTARTLIEKLESGGRRVTEVVSGGAAGADHVAVRLFLDAPEVRPLRLELAAQWDFEHSVYGEAAVGNWLTNPGRTLNRHLRRFELSAGVSAFDDLGVALRDRQCRWRVHADGLLGRNSVVAEADAVLAMTFGQARQIAQGGTADTCRKYRARGGREIYHLDLNSGGLFEDGVVPSAKG